jgi:hypothetical protein
MDIIDVFGGYSDDFVGSQGTFLVRHDAWRDLGKCRKSFFFIAGISQNNKSILQ